MRLFKISHLFSKKVAQKTKEKPHEPLGLFENPVCCKISKKLKGGPFGDKKFEKSNNAEKIQREDPIVSSGFVSYVKHGVNEMGNPLH